MAKSSHVNIYHKLRLGLNLARAQCVLPFSRIDFKRHRIKCSVLSRSACACVYLTFLCIYTKNVVNMFQSFLQQRKNKSDVQWSYKRQVILGLFCIELLTLIVTFFMSQKSCQIFETIINKLLRADKNLNSNNSSKFYTKFLFSIHVYQFCHSCYIVWTYWIRHGSFDVHALALVSRLSNIILEHFVFIFGYEFSVRFSKINAELKSMHQKTLSKTLISNKASISSRVHSLQKSYVLISEAQQAWRRFISVFLLCDLSYLFLHNTSLYVHFFSECTEHGADLVVCLAYTTMCFDGISRAARITWACGTVTIKVKKKVIL
jgi:hypothetical protein